MAAPYLTGATVEPQQLTPKQAMLIAVALQARRDFWLNQSTLATRATDLELQTIADGYVRDYDDLLYLMHNG